jgi:aquaporin Z
MSGMSEQNRIACAEAIGTLILVVGGAGTAVLATGGFLTTNSVGELGVALAFGLSLLCAAYAIGSISGCHINPAVTAGMWALGKTKSRDVPYYVVGQVAGGLVGAGIIYAIAHSHGGFDAKASGFASNGYGAHSPGGFKLPAVILTEIIFTGLFVFVIASTSRRSMSPGFTGLTVGLMLTLIHLVTIPVDNTSVNPARSIATAVVQHGWALGQVWVFIVFPVLGGLLGGYTWKSLVAPEDA